MKLIRKPMIPTVIVIIVDILALALAAVLNILRARIPASYQYHEELVYIEITHPYELFGIFTAAALVIAAVMTGFIIAAAITGGKSRMVSRITGGAVLLIFSAAVILFAHFIVRGQLAEKHACFVFEDGEYMIAVQETQYADGSGTVEVFRIEELQHDHESIGTAEHEHYSVEFLTASELFDFSTDNTRYELEWGYSDDLIIRFEDKGSYRSFHIKLEQNTAE